MKKSILLVLTALGVVSLTDCKKDNSTPNYSMQAIINGRSFNASYCYADSLGNAMIISGYNPSKTQPLTELTIPNIQLGLANYKGIGTYTITSYDGTSFGFVDSTGLDNYPYCVYGSVTVTAITPAIIGSFNFTTNDSTRVTNGTFISKLQIQK